MLNRLWERLIKSKSLMLASSSVASGILSGFSFIFLAYSLSEADFGKISYCNAVLALASPLSSLGVRGGLAAILPRENAIGRYLAGSLVIQFSGSLIASLAVALLAFSQEDGILKALLLIYIVPLWLDSAEIFSSALVATGRINIVAASTFVASLCASLLRFIFAMLGLPVIVFSLPALIQRIVLYAVQLREFCLPSKSVLVKYFRDDCWLKVLKYSAPVLITSFSVSVYTYIDQLMLPKYVGFSGLGSYALAVTILSFCLMIPVSVARAWEPALHRAHAMQDFDNLSKLERMYLKRILIASFCMMAGVSIFIELASGIIEKTQYHDSGYMIFQMLIQIALVGLGGCYYSALSRINNWKWLYAANCALAASFNILLNTMLIPNLGVSGAILATNLALIILCIACGLSQNHFQRANV